MFTDFDSLFCWLTSPVNVNLPNCSLVFSPNRDVPPLIRLRSGGHADVARLNALDYLILLTLIIKFQILGVEVKGRVGVVGHVELHLVAHRGGNRSLYLLVKVEECLSS